MTDDVALLERYNPIPSASGENVDPCIFGGWLKNEPRVRVAVSGGCPYSDTFEVCCGLNKKAQCQSRAPFAKILVINYYLP